MSGYRPQFEAALRLFALHRDADLTYMNQLVRDETGGGYGIEHLRN